MNDTANQNAPVWFTSRALRTCEPRGTLRAMAGAVARYILQFVNDCGEPIETFESLSPFHSFAEGQKVELYESPGGWEVDAMSHSVGHTRDQRTLIVQMIVHLRERS